MSKPKEPTYAARRLSTASRWATCAVCGRPAVGGQGILHKVLVDGKMEDALVILHHDCLVTMLYDYRPAKAKAEAFDAYLKERGLPGANVAW